VVHRTFLLLALAAWLAAAALPMPAQTPADVHLMEKARAAYLTSPIPGSIACSVSVDWDTFFAGLKVPLTAEMKARMAKMKQATVAVTTTGPQNTTVTVDADPSLTIIRQGLQEQLEGFFQMYWAESYGRLLPRPGDAFELAHTADGYVEKTSEGPGKVTVQLDKALRVTRFQFQSPQITMDVTPGFRPGTDGLLRLHTIDQTVTLGKSSRTLHVDLDYQKVRGFDIPQHITMAVPSAYTFNYTLSGCQVKASTAPAT
jgi:hypothetical protein